MSREQRQQRATPAAVRNVEAALRTLRGAQRQLSRNPRAAIESAVEQLLTRRTTTGDDLDADARTYRIDELARLSDTTVRNIRAYQERGLLHPPTRQGRVALFDDTHLARLKVITSMLARGYTSGHIKEMLAAWESGKEIADVLGLESTLVGPHDVDAPETVTLTVARELAGGPDDLQLFVRAGLAEMKGNRVRLLRPELMRTIQEMRKHGLTTERLLEVHTAIVPEIDRITAILVEAGVRHFLPLFEADGTPAAGDIAHLVDLLQRFRALTMSSVNATLSDSLDHTIEGLLADYLSRYVDDASDAG